MKVYDANGKYLGSINDIVINFYESKVEGFTYSNMSLFSKKNFIDIKNILSLEDLIVVSKVDVCKGLTFNSIKYMDIVDNNNIMKGVIEDLIIDKKDYSIKGIVMSSGVIDTMFRGKEIILPKGCILCEKFMLYKGTEYIKLKTLPHNLGGVKL